MSFSKNFTTEPDTGYWENLSNAPPMLPNLSFSLYAIGNFLQRRLSASFLLRMFCISHPLYADVLESLQVTQDSSLYPY
jgi:hypothetical protein